MRNNRNKKRMTKKSIFFKKNGFFNHPFFIFLIFSLIHIILLLNIFFNTKYIILLILEFLFFLYFNKFNFKIILKIFIISFLIFLLNIFFSEGKIIYNLFLIRVTEQGLINGLKKSCLLMGTFFFTINILKDNNEKILISLSYDKKSNIVLNSIEYFLLFWKELGKNNNIKKLLIKIIRIYKGKKRESNNIENNNIILKKDFYVYNFVIIAVFFLIYFFL